MSADRTKVVKVKLDPLQKRQQSGLTEDDLVRILEAKALEGHVVAAKILLDRLQQRKAPEEVVREPSVIDQLAQRLSSARDNDDS